MKNKSEKNKTEGDASAGVSQNFYLSSDKDNADTGSHEIDTGLVKVKVADKKGTTPLIWITVIMSILFAAAVWADNSYKTNGIVAELLNKNKPKGEDISQKIAANNAWIVRLIGLWSALTHVEGNNGAGAKKLRAEIDEALVIYTAIGKNHGASFRPLEKVVYYYNMAEIHTVAADVYSDETKLIDANGFLETSLMAYSDKSLFSSSDIEYLKKHYPKSRMKRTRLNINALLSALSSKNANQPAGVSIEALNLFNGEFPGGCDEMRSSENSRIIHRDILTAVGC